MRLSAAYPRHPCHSPLRAAGVISRFPPSRIAWRIEERKPARHMTAGRWRVRARFALTSRGLYHEWLDDFAFLSLRIITPASIREMDITRYPAREFPVSA